MLNVWKLRNIIHLCLCACTLTNVIIVTTCDNIGYFLKKSKKLLFFDKEGSMQNPSLEVGLKWEAFDDFCSSEMRRVSWLCFSGLVIFSVLLFGGMISIRICFHCFYVTWIWSVSILFSELRLYNHEKWLPESLFWVIMFSSSWSYGTCDDGWGGCFVVGGGCKWLWWWWWW